MIPAINVVKHCTENIRVEGPSQYSTDTSSNIYQIYVPNQITLLSAHFLASYSIRNNF